LVIRPQQSFQARDERDHWRNSHAGLSVQATSVRPSWPLQKPIIPEDRSHRFRHVKVYHCYDQPQTPSRADKKQKRLDSPDKEILLRSGGELPKGNAWSLPQRADCWRHRYTSFSTRLSDSATFSTPKIEGKIINSKLGALHRTLRRPPR